MTKRIFDGVEYTLFTIGTGGYTASVKDYNRARKLADRLRSEKFYHVRVTRTSKGTPKIWTRYAGGQIGKLPSPYIHVKSSRYNVILQGYSSRSGAQKRIAANRRRGVNTPMITKKKYGKWYVYIKDTKNR